MKYLIALALAGVIFSVKAQEAPTSDYGRLVETACVGECGHIDIMYYRVPEHAGDEKLTFTIDRYQLCPNSTAAVRITVDGRLVNQFVINAETVHSFIAPSGSSVRIAAKVRVTDPDYICIIKGSVIMSLYAREIIGREPFLPPRPYKD